MKPLTGAPRVLVIANNPAATAALAAAIRERRAAGPATFTILVPNPDDALVFDHVTQDVHIGQHRLAVVLPMLEEGLGIELEGVASPSPSAYEDVLDELDARSYDEIIVPASRRTLPNRRHRELGKRLAELGYDVRIVAAGPERSSVAAGA
jgi:hypothetical protein